jgi:hypothetical protein
MNKSIFFTILCLCFGISTVATAQSYSGGAGTEGDPYLISSKADMVVGTNAPPAVPLGILVKKQHLNLKIY